MTFSFALTKDNIMVLFFVIMGFCHKKKERIFLLLFYFMLNSIWTCSSDSTDIP